MRVLVPCGPQRTAFHTFLEDGEKGLPVFSAVETSDGSQRGAVEEPAGTSSFHRNSVSGTGSSLPSGLQFSHLYTGNWFTGPGVPSREQ